MISTTQNYSLAEDVEIKYQKEQDKKLFTINFFHKLGDLYGQGIQKVYCRGQNWENQPERIAVQKDIKKSAHGPYTQDEYIRHGPNLDHLIEFYKNEGVKQPVLDKMALIVANFRDIYVCGVPMF